MVASLVSIPDFIRGRKTARTTGPWTNQELAELCRVVNLLARAGLTVETDSGQTDEGDPWMVFLRPGSGDVIAHFARIDGRFVAAGAGAGTVVEGDSFRDVVDKILDSQPLLMSQTGGFTGAEAPQRRAAAGGTRRGAGRGGDTAHGPAGSGSGSGSATGSDSSNVTSLFTHPSVVLAAFVATALMQGRKAADAGGTAGKASLDARSSGAQTNRPQLQDSLIALTATDAAGGGVGHGGFMLHSAGLASAMALVVAAVTPVTGSRDGTTQTMLETLSRAVREDDSAQGAEGQAASAAAGAPPADAHEADPRAVTATSDGARAIEGLDAGKPAAKGERPSVALAAETLTIPGTPDPVIDADLFLAELMQGAAPGRSTEPAAAQARAETASTPDPVAAGATLDSSGEVSSQDDAESDTADKDNGSGGTSGSSSQTAVGEGETRSGSGEAETAQVGPNDTTEDAGDGQGSGGGLASDAKTDDDETGSSLGEAGRIGDDIALTDDALRLLDVLRDGDVADGDALDSLLGNLDGTVTIDPLAPDAGSIGNWMVVVRPDGSGGGGTGDPASGDGSAAPGSQIIVYSGGQLRLEAFDPAVDMLSVTGAVSSASYYDIVTTSEGVDIRFDADNVVTLVGVGLDDLGLA
ncbi:hypothetical protein [Roseospira goensis]|uniref:Uncharacterized protein n=1 Tax=Roseospira goensis TaxID=391922 RepID=A0A7W6RYD1_9PROT|nr:hypothetical protein [Roseospira goensis]MBB4285513.1 hypothetical protein [Roseospira goensis]